MLLAKYYHDPDSVNMAYRLLLYIISRFLESTAITPKEASMNLENIDASKCDRAEKEVIEGLCLSYDMMNGVCLETMQECDAIQKDDE